MNWRLLTWKDIVGILFVVAIVGAILYVFGDPAGQRRPTNFGFGPEWSCTHMPGRDPVCVKRTLSTESK
jgi:hypothetical protein